MGATIKTCVCGNHVWWVLRRASVALVSPVDAHLVEARVWNASCERGGARRVRRNSAGDDGARRTVYLHREIARPPAGMVVDHINLNPLDNRRENLRLATPTQNNLNRRAHRNKTPGLRKGTRQSGAGFSALIGFRGRQIYLGRFASVEEAHAAYAAKARELFGEFARAE